MTSYCSITYRFSLQKNSAVTDKPRDTFVQVQWHGWPPKNTLFPYDVTSRTLVVLGLTAYDK